MEEKSINKSKWVYFKFCTRCNTAIGAFEENIEYLKNAISYLEVYKNEEKYK